MRKITANSAQAPQYLNVRLEEETGLFVATLVGLEEPRGEGRTRGEAVEELQGALGDPEMQGRLTSTSRFSGRFSVRIPSSLHQALDALASIEGVSLNSLVSTVLAERAGHEVTAPSPKAIPEETLIGLLPVDDVEGHSLIDSAHIALRVAYTVARDFSQPSIGLALAILCGDRWKHFGSKDQIADHYGKVAWLAKQKGFTTLALALWEEGLRIKPEGNHKSSSSYGQLLYELGRYARAADCLKDVPDRDGSITYKKACLRTLPQGLEQREERTALLDSIREVMRMWAYGSSSQQEAKNWRRHVADLECIGTNDVAELGKELRDFARKHSRWR